MHKSKKIIYLEKILRWMSIIILRRHKPKIIGITGSVGKSSAKEAICLALRNNFKVRKNIENYNNEIGVPLTIIGAKSGDKNPLKWLVVFLKWLFWLIMPIGYPKILILEMAVDHPGDMKYLTEFISTELAILTDISLSHLKFFKNVNQIAKEKTLLVKNISKNGMAIFNMDSLLVNDFAQKFTGNSVGVGIKNDAIITASDIHFNYIGNKLNGLSFKLNFQGNIVPFRLPNIIATHQVYAVLIAVAVANYFKMNLLETAKSLEKFESPPGRMNLFQGINNSLIIDDTYNASPISTKAAIETLRSISSNRKIVILGDMLELGRQSEKKHQEIIENILNDKEIDILITVGKRNRLAIQVILSKKKIFKTIISFDNSQEVVEAIDEKIKINKGDLMLVKGSRAMQMEKIVKKFILK